MGIFSAADLPSEVWANGSRIASVCLRTFALFAAIAATQPCVVGAAWVQKRGHGILIAGLNRYFADERFSLDGAREPLGPDAEFRSWTPNVWMEVGLTNRWTGIFSFSVPTLRYEDRFYRASATAAGDMQAGFRRALRASDRGWQVSLQALAKAPAYSARTQPRPGNGQGDLEMLLQAGRSFPVGRRWGYFSGEGGYRIRWGRPADQWRGEASGGLHVNSRVTLMTQVFGIRSTGHFPALPAGVNPQVEPWFHLLRVQPSAVIRLGPQLRLQGGYGWDVAGRNIGIGRQWVFAVWKTF